MGRSAATGDWRGDGVQGLGLLDQCDVVSMRGGRERSSASRAHPLGWDFFEGEVNYICVYSLFLSLNIVFD